MKLHLTASMIWALALSPQALAVVNVFTCEPEWGALAAELAGTRASVYTATTALQDPHRIEARPSLIARMRGADLVVCTGADLEAGWLPLLLSQSGNRGVQKGTRGYFEASQFVTKLDVPKVLDRAHGDVHPEGNPHVHTDARNIARIAEGLTARFAEVDPAGAAAYRDRGAQFQARWREAIARWEKQAAPVKGATVVVYHKDWAYLLAWLGLREAGSLEPRPGIPPSTSHLAELVSQMQRAPAKAILFSAYQDPRPGQFLSQRTMIPAVVLPYTVGGNDAAKDLFSLFDDTVSRLVKVLQ
jgi:zinc/manganese transport system substrate-binding protein